MVQQVSIRMASTGTGKPGKAVLTSWFGVEVQVKELA
jgi:hypothetical protein